MDENQTTANDHQQQPPTEPRVHDTFIDITTYSHTLPKISSSFIAAGLHRTDRSLQRYCENGSIDARKYNTAKGVLWLANPESVDLKIKEILELEKATSQMATTVADSPTQPDMSSSSAHHNSGYDDTATIDDHRRQSFDVVAHGASEATVNRQTTAERPAPTNDTDRYMTVPVDVLDALTDQLTKKDKQIERRDEEIKRMTEERDIDRKLLTQALHLIHGDNFDPALPGKTETPPPIQEHSEIKPVPPSQTIGREGDNEQNQNSEEMVQ